MTEVFSRGWFRRLDWYLVGVVFLLTVMGLVNLKSAGAETGIWKMQLLWLGIGILLMMFFMWFDYKRWEALSLAFYFLCLFLLILVLFIGKEVHNSRAWLDFKGINFQPSELGKLGVILVLARIYHRRETQEPMGLKELIYPGLVILFPAFLIALEPDLGTCLIYLIFGASLIIFMRVKKRFFILLFIIVLSFSPVCWKYVLKPHQKVRILTFLQPEKDPRGAGYNLLQSKIAIGSGGIWGKGWQKGTQTMLRFLPEQHTDFAFSVWAEEWGFILGVFPAILLYLLIFWRGISIASQAKDRLGVMLSLGAVMIIFVHFLTNLAMISGYFPIIGVPLSFFSYGGSHLVLCFALIGLLLNVNMRRYVF